MKNATRNYTISIAIMLAIFNVIAFAAPGWTGADKYTGSFWIGYIAVTVAFIAHYLLTIRVLQHSEENATKLFYNIPIIYYSYIGLIVSIIIGALCMLNSKMPGWIAIIVSVIVIGYYAIVITRTSIAIDIIEKVDTKIVDQTTTMRDLTTRSKGLADSAASPEAKAACNRVYEALRYSDPMSNDATKTIENEISMSLSQLASSIRSTDASTTQKIANDLIAQISERNELCKRGKNTP